MLISSLNLVSQINSNWSLQKPYTGKYAYGINTFDLGVSYLNTTYPEPLVFTFSFTFFNWYLSYGSNYEGSFENVYGEGYITNKYLLETIKTGYCFTTNKWLYIIPFIGFTSKSQLYSDMEYNHVKFASSNSYFNTGIIVGASFKNIDFKYICGAREQGVTIVLNLLQFIDTK